MKKAIKLGGILICGMLALTALAGIFMPEKGSTASVPVVSERVLVPGGQSVGVKMDVKGVLVVGLEEIEGEDGEKINPGVLSGLQIGDMILTIDGQEVYRADEVKAIVNETKDVVTLKIKRNNDVMDIDIKPAFSKEDNSYKLGIWVKDKTAGIGTLTYYDPSTSSFGALGHGIVDPETNSVLSVDTGLLLEARVHEVQEGKEGQPGEIRGIFYHTDEPLGSLEKNCEFGVFGSSYHPIENSLYSKPLAVGTKEQVEKGSAYILCTLSDNKVQRFEIEIEKINNQESAAEKSMVIRVTDEKLLEESGGIVQGMSGSPIIQNDRIIGAVTHVFVNDPTRGYGIFIENMLDATG